MEKYVVVKILNSELDACSIQAKTNPSGVCTCSTGDDTPWVFAESGIFSNKPDAFKYANELFEQLLSEFRKEGANDGWDVIYNEDRCIFALHIDDNTGTGDKVWVAKVVILEIFDKVN